MVMMMMMTGGWSGESEMLVDGISATRLTQQCPATTSTTTSYRHSVSVSDYNTTFGGSALVDLINCAEGLRTSTSGAVFVGPPLSVACGMDVDASPATVRLRLSDGGLRQHVVGVMSDRAATVVDDRPRQPAGGTVNRLTDMPPPVARQVGRGAERLVDGVLAQRAASISVLHAAASTTSRVRGGGGGASLARSCGDALLKRAAVGLANHRTAAGRSTARSRGAPSSSARVAAGIRSSSSSSRLSDGDGCGAGRVPSYLALDDHRYTLRCPPPTTTNPQPPPSKVPKTGSRLSGMRQSASSGSLVGVTSILEAFLRTTRPMDPNKGSNAALAAAGLSHLPLGGAATRAISADHAVDDDDASGTLLKKLLTGEFDQNDVQRSFQTTSGPSEMVVDSQTPAHGAAASTVDSLLAEGFALDADFSFNLLDDMPDDGLWMTTHADDFDDKVDHLMSFQYHSYPRLT